MELLLLLLTSVGVLTGHCLGRVFPKERSHSLKNLTLVCHGAFLANLIVLSLQSILLALVSCILYFFVQREIALGLILVFISTDFFLLACVISFVYCYTKGAQQKDLRGVVVATLLFFTPTMLRFVI